MEPCTRTPDLFHGRTRTETAALHPPPLRYTAVRTVYALIPDAEWQYVGGQQRKLPLVLRRIEYSDNPLSLCVTPKRPEQIEEVWEILHPNDPDRSYNVLLKRRIPTLGYPLWCYWDGAYEQQERRIGDAVWEAMNDQQVDRSSTGWRKDRWPNPPEY